MIPANELRINDWVLVQSNKLIEDKSTYFRIRVVTPKECHKYEPIPLTPELLIEKCGFKNYQPSSYYTLNRWFELRLEEGVVFEYDLYRDRCAQVLYLHQLQNLYFSLFSEELSIAL